MLACCDVWVVGSTCQKYQGKLPVFLLGSTVCPFCSKTICKGERGLHVKVCLGWVEQSVAGIVSPFVATFLIRTLYVPFYSRIPDLCLLGIDSSIVPGF